MRFDFLFAALACAAPLAAQEYYIPDNQANVGICNVIPFGSTAPGSFANCRFQTRCTVADLGGLPNLITGLGFASCATGSARYGALKIVLDHISPTQPLSTTFDSNLTPNAVTVLDVTDYQWNVVVDTWNEIGLQDFFVYNGTDDLVIDIVCTDSIAPAGFRRGTRERVFWSGASGPAPANGSSGLAASKVEVTMLTARASSYGRGCGGTNGTPLHGFTGTPQQGTTMTLELQNGVPNGVAILFAGSLNSFPFPLELSIVGMPNCFAYTDLAFTALVVLDGAGATSIPLAIPQGLVLSRIYTQFAVLDLPVNQLGLTTSNYLRILTGN